MKFYFDNLNPKNSNHDHLTYSKKSSYWLVAPGAPIKQEARKAGIELDVLDNLNEPGCYIIDVNGDPIWWLGVGNGHGSPNRHILHLIKENVLNLARNNKIRIVIAGDREGGPMTEENFFDGFAMTTAAMKELKLPPQSVLITCGNKKVERQYDNWLSSGKKRKKFFEVMYSNHFGNIFVNDQTQLPTTPLILSAIENNKSYDYNSLNRIYRRHRGAHLYSIASNDILDKGIVSANQIDLSDPILNELYPDYQDVVQQHYPKYVDGNWSGVNAAGQINFDIYKNSLMSFITETIFHHDVAFLTEKIFKPITAGHPLILLSSPGTLKALEELGFKTEWCGIDPSYNDIKDDLQRFDATHKELYNWVTTSRDEKHKRILSSLDVIEHNFNLIRQKDFYHDALHEIVARSEKHFGLNKV